MVEITPVKLAKVSDWEWTLYQLGYSNEEDGKVKLTRHVVSTPDHIEYDAMDRWPNSSLQWVKWEPLRKVDQPQHVGSYRGLPISESGWETARRLIKETKIKVGNDV